MDITQSLQKLGLTSNETAVYLFLLSNGPNSGTDIYTTLGLDKASCYRAINSLLKLGLINTSGATKNQQFFIEDVYHLHDLINTKEKELASIRNDFSELINSIEANSEQLYKSQNIEIFQGKDGYLLWNERRLKGNHKLIKELGTRKFLNKIISDKEYNSYMRGYLKKRVSKNIHMQSLGDISEEHDDIDITDPKLLKEARTFPKDLGMDAFLSIFGDHFGYYSFKADKFMGVIVFDPMMSKLLSAMFDVLWQQANINYLKK
jgi:sugar-specific transcriptional regulator TrmB